MSKDTDLFRQIDNALLDLQASQLQSYERPLKTLGRLLRSDELTEINKELTKDVDFEGFIQASERTEGSFVGTAQLAWPEDVKQTLDLTLILIDKFATKPTFALDFGHAYFYSGDKIIAGLHSIVRQLLIQFVRDYKDYVNSRGNVTPKLVLPSSGKIFIAHGHDGEARETVARFLEGIDYRPIILHEQANKGRTIIEKVEANSYVGFAVVILTPDDEGCAKGGTPEPRARQNVLLELGYFLGCLGRDRVCTLKKGDMNIPSDFEGVVWESMESGTWRQSLGRELAAAGYQVDWNKVMRR